MKNSIMITGQTEEELKKIALKNAVRFYSELSFAYSTYGAFSTDKLFELKESVMDDILSISGCMNTEYLNIESLVKYLKLVETEVEAPQWGIGGPPGAKRITYEYV
jgi:hypothetical protein